MTITLELIPTAERLPIPDTEILGYYGVYGVNEGFPCLFDGKNWIIGDEGETCAQPIYWSEYPRIPTN